MAVFVTVKVVVPEVKARLLAEAVASMVKPLKLPANTLSRTVSAPLMRVSELSSKYGELAVSARTAELGVCSS